MAKFDFDRLLGKESMPLSSVRLENIDKKTNTNKFYEIHVEQDFSNLDAPFRVVVYYGRIGAQKPRTEIKYESKNERLCSTFANQLKEEKLRKKGYSLAA